MKQTMMKKLIFGQVAVFYMNLFP